MQTDDPPFLTVGTEVSAKFKGAFCEAKIKKVNKNIKVKVLLKEHPYRSQFVMLEDLPKETKLEINEIVQVLDASKTYMMRAVIQGFKDCSRYHVVFNDGDEKELRRTQVCLKGGKHFDAAVNLDAMPLTNPEQFSSPVLKNSGKKRGGFVKKRKDESPPSKSSRKRDDDDEDDDEEDEVEEGTKKREKRAAASAATAAISEAREKFKGNETQSDDDSEADSSEEKERGREKKKQREEEREKEKERERLEKEEERKLEKAKKKQIRMNLKNIRIEQREQMKQQREIEREKKRLEKEQQKERRRREMKEKELRKASEGKKRKSFDADRSGEDVDYLPRKKTSKSQAQSISKEDVDLAEERIKNVVGKHRMTKKFVYTMRKAYAKSKKDIELEEDEEDDDPNVPSTSKQTKKSKHELLDESDEESDDDDDKKRVKIKELGELMFSKKRKQFEKLREIYQQLDPALQKKFKKKTKLISNYKHLRKRGRWSHHIKFTDRKNRTAKRKVQLERLSPGSIGVRFGDEKVPDKVRQLMRKQAENKPTKKAETESEEEEEEGSSLSNSDDDDYESTSKRGRRKQRDDDSESQQRDSEYRRTHDDSPYTSSGRKKRLVSESMGSDTSSVVGPDVKKGGKRGPKSSRNSVSFGRSPSHNDRERSVSTGKSGQRGRKKKDDSSFDEEEARRRSKLGRPKNERRPIASGSGTAVAQEADDEPYVECNVISRFYLGQKVRARYNTNWYDARVVDIRQSTVQDIIRIIAPCILEAELDREIVGQLQIKNKEFHIYVHYLGWNSRYDEWVEAEAVKISMKDQHQSRIQFREHSEDISSNLIACAETCLSEKVSFADTLKSVQETFATWEDRRLTNGLAEVSVASPARQSMSPSMLTSPEQVKYGLNERTEQIMKQMQHEPNATLRDVATATVGIASRDRGSRLLLSPPGGRSQKTLLHQVSTSAEAGLQALRSSERKSEGPSTSAGSSDAGNQNASSSIPSSSAIVLSPALSLARSGPLTLDLPSTSAAATKVSSLVKNRGARSVSPNDVYYGDNYDDYDKEEEDSDDMEDMEDEDQKKSIDDDENEDQEMKEESKSPVPLDSDEDEKMDVDDVKSPDRSGTKTPVDYDSTRKSTRQSTVASSTASINAQKAITSIVQSSPLNQSGPLTFSPEPVKSTPQRGRRRKSPELDNRMEVEETKEVVTDEDKEDTDEQKSEGTAEDSSVASRKPRTPDDSVLSVDATLQDKEDEDDKSGKSSTPFDAPDFPSPRGLQPGRGKRKNQNYRLGRPPGPNAKQPKLMTPPVKKTSEKGDDSQDDLDEDEAPTTPTSSRDTFHTLKTRMYKLMEHENSLNDYSILGFADLDEEMSGLADEELNEFLENRAYELRDIYTTAKSEVVQMEKKKRRFMEKGKSDKPNSVPTKKNLTPKSNGSSTGVPRNLRASSADRKANTNGIKPERSFEV